MANAAAAAIRLRVPGSGAAWGLTVIEPVPVDVKAMTFPFSSPRKPLSGKMLAEKFRELVPSPMAVKFSENNENNTNSGREACNEARSEPLNKDCSAALREPGLETEDWNSVSPPSHGPKLMLAKLKIEGS
jgi:hypothetical protein